MQITEVPEETCLWFGYLLGKRLILTHSFDFLNSSILITSIHVKKICVHLHAVIWTWEKPLMKGPFKYESPTKGTRRPEVTNSFQTHREEGAKRESCHRKGPLHSCRAQAWRSGGCWAWVLYPQRHCCTFSMQTEQYGLSYFGLW